jgi:hypothetical protein
MTPYRTGLLIVRAWIEKGSLKPLRAHIRATTDVSRGFDSEVTVAGVPAASVRFQAWLASIMAEGQADEQAESTVDSKFDERAAEELEGEGIAQG